MSTIPMLNSLVVFLIDNIKIPVGGSGFVIQLGFESIINGGFLNIQQIDLYVKQGRLN